MDFLGNFVVPNKLIQETDNKSFLQQKTWYKFNERIYYFVILNKGSHYETFKLVLYAYDMVLKKEKMVHEYNYKP